MHESIALFIFASFFSLIAAVFLLIVRSLPVSISQTTNARKWAFLGLALASFLHTWFYMIQFLVGSLVEYEIAHPPSTDLALPRLTAWLVDTTLFEQAWLEVCSTSIRWVWSQQICLYTIGAWTTFLHIEGQRYSIKHPWAYMLFGQIVAISTASNLFFLALVLADPVQDKKTPRPETVPARLILSCLTALGFVAVLPYVPKDFFLVSLLLMHVVIFCPLVVPATSPTRFSISTTWGLTLITLVSVGLHVKAIMEAAAENVEGKDFMAEILSVVHVHPAQASISWDVVWASVSFSVWALTEKTDARMSVVAYTPFLSVATTAPLVLIQSEVAPIPEPYGDEDEKDI